MPLAPPKGRRRSLRRQLLWSILLPVLALLVVSAAMLYQQALNAANTAYDRTLLASAKSIGELLGVESGPNGARLTTNLPYAALEAFEADNRSRMYFRVTGFGGDMASGFADMPAARPARQAAGDNPYAALVHFYDDTYKGEDVRMAVLLQPVAGAAGQGMATIQVAETLELRHSLARELLLQILWQQALLVAVIVAVVSWAVQRATRPVRALSQRLQARAETDLTPMQGLDTPRELQPVVEATNGMLSRLANLLEHQKRFVRDASHQLRTPLAVLKVQVQSARRGDVEPNLALREIELTVQRATDLANQMLALAKVEQLRQIGPGAADTPVVDWAQIVEEVALDVSALAVQGRLDLELALDLGPGPAARHRAPVRAHAWALKELTRNLLHNAIKHGPPHTRLLVGLSVDPVLQMGRLCISDEGPGLADTQRVQLFEAFAASGSQAGSGLGLAICLQIVQALKGRIGLDNRVHEGKIHGLDAWVTLPLHQPESLTMTTAPA